MKHIGNIGKLLLIPACFATLSSAKAATLMQTNFNSLATGAVTEANLNSVTTGGTWTLNNGRGATYTIEGPTGDHALVVDDTNGGNGGLQIFTTVVLADVADFSVDAVSWSFNTATGRVGMNKTLRYEFFNGATSVANLVWGNSGTAVLTAGASTDSQNSAFTTLAAWDETDTAVRAFNAVFEGTTLNVNFGGQSLSVNLGGSSIDRMSLYSGGADTANKGGYLDNMLVTQIPEPSAAFLGGIGVLMLLRRRRCA
ncbi:MAG: hypothetical protein V4727_12310 [Verrucomicrobiota bacterium]